MISKMSMRASHAFLIAALVLFFGRLAEAGPIVVADLSVNCSSFTLTIGGSDQVPLEAPIEFEIRLISADGTLIATIRDSVAVTMKADLYFEATTTQTWASWGVVPGGGEWKIAGDVLWENGMTKSLTVQPDTVACPQTCTGAIGDLVWQDVDGAGIQNLGEPGIANVRCILKDGDGIVRATATTDSLGLYRFPGLCNGAYTVETDSTTLAPNFFATVSEAPGSIATNDSNASPTLVTLPFDDSVDLTVDSGYRLQSCTGKIGDFIWNDLNNNGIQDSGEPGISGVIMILKNIAGSIIATTFTNSAGFYEFKELCKGDYTVELDSATVPLGFAPTLFEVGSVREIDNNAKPSTITLPTDFSEDRNVDCGFAQCGPCAGGITALTLHYHGLTEALIQVLRKDGAVAFSGSVEPGRLLHGIWHRK